MKNQPESPSTLRLERPWEPNAGRGTLAEYLDDFCLPLLDVMTEKEVIQYRLLAEEHLLDLIEEFQSKGLTSHGALHAALREHGDPGTIGELLRREMLREKVPYAGELAIRRRARQGAFLAGGLYMTLALAMWLFGTNSPFSIISFFLSPLPVGAMGGMVAFGNPVRPILWAGIALAYPVALTALILVILSGTTGAFALMPFWIGITVLIAGGTWRFCERRHRSKLYSRLIA